MGEKDFYNQLAVDGSLLATGVGSEIIDFGVANPNKGAGTPLEAEITVKTPGAGTSVIFNLQDCDTEGGTYVVIAQTRLFTGAELTAGRVIKLPLPDENRRYLKLGWTSDLMTAGTVDAYLQP